MPELPPDRTTEAPLGPAPADLLIDHVPGTATVEPASVRPTASDAVPEAPSEVARKKLGLTFWLGTGWVGFIILLALVADLLPLDNPNTAGVALPGLGPSAGHLLGTDELGRDMLSRVIFGSRVSLIVGFASIAFGLLIGGTLGMLAGFYRKVADFAITGAANILLAFPALVLGLAIVTFMGPSLSHVTLAIGILSIAPLTLVVRGSTIVFAQREFVLAARMLGASNRRILFREILANVLPSAASLALVGIAVAIVAEGGLSFLGLSVRPPTPTWGNMISEGRIVLSQYPAIAFWPALMMFITVLALNLAGDRLRTYFDVKETGL